MPNFKYTAKDLHGKEITGTLNRSSVEECIDEIRGRGLFVVKVDNLDNKSKGILDLDLATLFKRRLPYKTLSMIARTLSFLLKSSVPSNKAIDLLKLQTKKKHLHDIFDSMTSNLVDGSTLSQEFKKNEPYFPPLIADLVEAGEGTGQIDNTLEELANFYDKQGALRSSVITAMLYPGFILASAIGAVIFILVYALPAIAGMLEKFNVELPLITRLLLFISDIFLHYSYAVVIVVVAIVLGFKYALKVDKFRYTVHRMFLKVPVMSDLVLKINLSRFTRTYGMLHESGARVMDIARSSEKTLSNYYLRVEVSKALSQLPDGVNLSSALEGAKVIPRTLIEIIRIGELSGTLSDGLLGISTQYDKDVDQSVKRLSSVIDPILMLFVGVVVGFIVLAMFLPIFSLTDIAQ
jgi:type IV pilus assembly protein PilC